MSRVPIVPSGVIRGRAQAVADAAINLLTRGPTPIVVHDESLVIVGWNEAATSCFGFSSEDALGRSIADLLVDAAGAASWRAALESPAEPATLSCKRKAGAARRCSWTFEAISQAIRGEPGSKLWLCAAEPLPGPSLKERVLGAILDNLPISVWAVDRQGDYVFHDGLGIEQIGVVRGSFVGLNMWEMWKDVEGTGETLRQVQVALDSNEHTHAFADAMGMVWESWCVPLVTEDAEDAEADLVVSTTMDITAHRRVEAELRERVEQIERQQKIIHELTTPIIEVWDGVLTMPMMGPLDSDQATQMMERMLGEVARKRARYAILDLTGVEKVGTQTAAYLVSLVRAIRLLGAQAIITGVRPSVAQTLVSLHADLSTIPMRSNLRSGLQYCMRRG